MDRKKDDDGWIGWGWNGMMMPPREDRWVGQTQVGSRNEMDWLRKKDRGTDRRNEWCVMLQWRWATMMFDIALDVMHQGIRTKVTMCLVP